MAWKEVQRRQKEILRGSSTHFPRILGLISEEIAKDYVGKTIFPDLKEYYLYETVEDTLS
jgi:hypothetical protein